MACFQNRDSRRRHCGLATCNPGNLLLWSSECKQAWYLQASLWQVIRPLTVSCHCHSNRSSLTQKQRTLTGDVLWNMANNSSLKNGAYCITVAQVVVLPFTGETFSKHRSPNGAVDMKSSNARTHFVSPIAVVHLFSTW